MEPINVIVIQLFRNAESGAPAFFMSVFASDIDEVLDRARRNSDFIDGMVFKRLYDQVEQLFSPVQTDDGIWIAGENNGKRLVSHVECVGDGVMLNLRAFEAVSEYGGIIKVDGKIFEDGLGWEWLKDTRERLSNALQGAS